MPCSSQLSFVLLRKSTQPSTIGQPSVVMHSEGHCAGAYWSQDFGSLSSALDELHPTKPTSKRSAVCTLVMPEG